jgi:hypothetical protein
MGDYSFAFESNSETSSKGSNISEYASSIEDLDQMLTENEYNKSRYRALVNKKYETILDFNEGKLDLDIYYSTINIINNQLESIEINYSETNHLLVEEEIKFQLMIDEYISKIERIRGYNDKSIRDFFEPSEVARIKALYFMIKQLVSKYEEKEEDISDEPLSSSIFNMESLIGEEKEIIEMFAKKLKVNFPVKPEIENTEALINQVKGGYTINGYFLNEDFKKFCHGKVIFTSPGALKNKYNSFLMTMYNQQVQEFYENMNIMLPGYFKQFSDIEKKDIDLLAKKLSIDKPKDLSLLDKYYHDVSQLLPGYRQTMHPTKIETIWELVSIFDIKQKMKNDIKLMLELPIPVSGEDMAIMETNRFFKSALKKMEKNVLIDCIMSPENKKDYNLKKQKADEPKRTGPGTIRLEGNKGNTINSLTKQQVNILTKQRNIWSTIGTTQEQQTKTFSEEEKENLKLIVERKNLMIENLNNLYRLKEREVIQNLIPGIQLIVNEPVVLNIIPDYTRRNSLNRIINSMNYNLPMELKPFVNEISTQIENFIFKINVKQINNVITQYYFLEYINKVEDILFIFDNYQDLKLKLLRPIPDPKIPGFYTTEIKFYQIVLFEKEICYSAKLYIFPVSVVTRKNVINILKLNFKNKPFISQILKKIRIMKKSKELELMLFNMSQNESDYLSYGKKLIELVNSSPQEILSGNMSVVQILELLTLNKIKSDEKYKEMCEKLDKEKKKYHEDDPEKFKWIDKIEKLPVSEYTTNSINEIQALIDSKLQLLTELEKRRKELDSTYFEGEYILLWKPPESLILPHEVKKWYDIVNKIKIVADRNGIKNVNILKSLSVTELTNDMKLIINWLKELFKYKQFLATRYSLSAAPEHIFIVNEIVKEEKILVKLEKIRDEKKNEELELYRNKYIGYLQRKFKPPPESPLVRTIKEFPMLTLSIINQMINSLKRKLILESDIHINYPLTKTIKKESTGFLYPFANYLPSFIVDRYSNVEISSYQVTTPSYKFIDKNLKIGKLLTYLELYDLNDYYNGLKINNNVPELFEFVYENPMGETVSQTKIRTGGTSQDRFMDPALHKRIQDYLLVTINQLVTKDYKSINLKYKKIATEMVKNFIGYTGETDTYKQTLEMITANFPKEYIPQQNLTDFYGVDIFKKLTETRNPLDFFDFMLQKNYNVLIKNNTIKKIAEFRRPRVLFNELTGRFGDQAYDGNIYDVEMLDKDFATDQPIEQTKIIMEKDPRTGLWVPVNKKTYKRGPYAWILRIIGTNEIDAPKEVWLEVPKGSVRLYTMDYDSCSRFNTMENCVGPGLNGSVCRYKNNACVSSMEFGKKKGYSFKDSQIKRRRAINQRIKLEKKKLKTLRKAAMAFKKRLVSLRTLNKKNQKYKKILTKDINYIIDKYLSKK